MGVDWLKGDRAEQKQKRKTEEDEKMRQLDKDRTHKVESKEKLEETDRKVTKKSLETEKKKEGKATSDTRILTRTEMLAEKFGGTENQKRAKEKIEEDRRAEKKKQSVSTVRNRIKELEKRNETRQ